MKLLTNASYMLLALACPLAVLAAPLGARDTNPLEPFYYKRNGRVLYEFRPAADAPKALLEKRGDEAARAEDAKDAPDYYIDYGRRDVEASEAKEDPDYYIEYGRRDVEASEAKDSPDYYIDYGRRDVEASEAKDDPDYYIEYGRRDVEAPEA